MNRRTPLPPGRRIGMVTQWYDPEGGSAAVPGAIARALAAQGREVHVLTGFPNYPSGRIHAGYRQRWSSYELRDGVHVHRVPLVPTHDRSARNRAVNYLSYAVSASVRWRLLHSVDVWLVSASPATAALPVMVARTLFGRAYVLLVQDLWPDTVVESGFVRPGRALRAVERALHRFCDASYRGAAAVAVTAPGMARILGSRGVPDRKLSVVPNWVDETVFRPVPRDERLAGRLGLDGFVVMFAGGLGELQGLDTAVEAAALLRDLPGFRLVFVGSGIAEPQLRAQAARLGLPNVRFLGQQPVEWMPALLALGDVQLVSLRDLPLFHATLPSKVQAALAAGRPVVGSVPGDARALIDASGAGLTADPGDPVSLAAAIRALHALGPAGREAMGRRGRAYYLDRLSERVGAGKLLALLDRAAGHVAVPAPAGYRSPPVPVPVPAPPTRGT